MGQVGLTETESVAQIQSDLLLSLSDSNAAIVTAYWQVPNLWASFADKASVYPRLQYYYTRRAAAQQLEGALRPLIDTEALDQSAKLNQQFTAAVTIRRQASEEIMRLEAIARASRAPAVGQMTTTEVKPLRSTGAFSRLPYPW